MPEIGQTISHYTIVEKLGAGGMGKVRKARDTRLDRTVALKVLKSAASPSADLRLRFEREARAIAALNHPHICTLFDVGRDGDTDFLVMEYCEGETLAQRLIKGPLQLEQVFHYGTEIAGALDKALRLLQQQGPRTTPPATAMRRPHHSRCRLRARAGTGRLPPPLQTRLGSVDPQSLVRGSARLPQMRRPVAHHQLHRRPCHHRKDPASPQTLESTN